jgi:hypothetical protein
VNPYTGVAIQGEPAIIFIELVNEPWHHPEDLPGSIRYINALTDAVRATGCTKLVFYNVSQDFRIGEAIRRSRAQGVTFGWYPTGLNSGAELTGNYLRSVDAFPDMLRPELARCPDRLRVRQSSICGKPPCTRPWRRTMRAHWAQAALMFAYDMLGTASRNLGWQTHYLNLVYTPRKAMSTVIAAEAMRRLPRMRAYGPYPGSTRFGDFHVSYEDDLAELVAADAFLYAGSTRATPPDPAALRRIAGHGSSATVTYEGEGIYFLDRVRPGVWRLEVYPDAVPVRDPFEPPSPDKIVTRAISRAWPMTIALPDLGASFTAQPITAGNSRTVQAVGGRFAVSPGVYVLSAAGPVDAASLPAYVGHVGFAEYHPPRPDSLPPSVQSLAAPQYIAGRDAEIRARVVDVTPPDSATLFIRPRAGGFYRGVAMRRAGSYEYAATVPAAALREGPHEFVITVFRGDSPVTFPEGLPSPPWAWNYHGRASWKLDVVAPRSPLRLFDPGADAARLAFTRIGDAGRRGLFRVAFSEVTASPVFHLELPVDSSGWGPDDYTASLVIADRIKARGAALNGADSLWLRLRGLGPRQVLHVTLMEDDGTSWSAAVAVDGAWSERSLPLSAFTAGRGVLLPQGFPGQWSYWVGPADGRGGAGDRPRLDRLERLQLTLRREGSRPRRAATASRSSRSSDARRVGRSRVGGRVLRATIRARVPDGTGTVYLAGNLPDLGRSARRAGHGGRGTRAHRPGHGAPGDDLRVQVHPGLLGSRSPRLLSDRPRQPSPRDRERHPGRPRDCRVQEGPQGLHRGLARVGRTRTPRLLDGRRVGAPRSEAPRRDLAAARL